MTVPNSWRWVVNCERWRSSSNPPDEFVAVDADDGSFAFDFERPHAKQERAVSSVCLVACFEDFFSTVAEGSVGVATTEREGWVSLKTN